MKTSLLLTLFAFSLLGAPSSPAEPKKEAILALVKTPNKDEDPGGLIQLPLRVRLITNLELEQKGAEMDMWVSAKDFEKKILPEINKIWKQANIQWVLESVAEQPAANLPDKEALAASIVNAKRKGGDKDSKQRVPNLLKLSSNSRSHQALNNLYLFPYIGQTNQGVAALGGNWAFSAVWTDKPFRAQKAPVKFPLTERRPFKIGSIARTCSHELGHNLGLKHPDKATQTRLDRLMGGKKHGYDLVPEEIATARKTALKRAKKIRDWAGK